MVSDGRTVVTALNRGNPFVLAAPQSKVSQDVLRMARALVAPVAQAGSEKPVKAPPTRKSLLAWR